MFTENEYSIFDCAKSYILWKQGGGGILGFPKLYAFTLSLKFTHLEVVGHMN